MKTIEENLQCDEIFVMRNITNSYVNLEKINTLCETFGKYPIQNNITKRYNRSLGDTKSLTIVQHISNIPKFLLSEEFSGICKGTLKNYRTYLFEAMKQTFDFDSKLATFVKDELKFRIPVKPKKYAIDETKVQKPELIVEILDGLERDYPRAYVLASLLYSGGFRSSELANLRWSDILQETDETVTFRILGKGRVYSNITVLKKIVDRAREEFGHETFVVCSTTGKKWKGRYINSYLKWRIEKKFNVRFTSHMGRHSLATNLLKSGVNIKTVQNVMRHSNLSTTSIYLNIESTIEDVLPYQKSIINRSSSGATEIRPSIFEKKEERLDYLRNLINNVRSAA